MESHSASRREFLIRATTPFLAGAYFGNRSASARGTGEPFRVHQWLRDDRNPIFPPRASFDIKRCMNPFVIRHDGHYWLFYGGADAKGAHRICLAIAAEGNVTKWERLGPLFDRGGPGSFDELWCVLPCVHRIGDQWHLYYTGRGKTGRGLQSFRGIGLAVSDDLRHWERRQAEPILTGGGFKKWPDNQGIAGGGRIIELPQADGRILYRMHYTLATGTPSKDRRIDQAKQSVSADSWDGIEWFDKRIMLEPRAEATYEDCATIALNIWPVENGWRAIYAGIGTRFSAYSICEAESADGLIWYRGQPDENLSIPPSGVGWESEMTAYPNVIEENGRLRLFYCGNGYGRTGIGTALAEPI